VQDAYQMLEELRDPTIYDASSEEFRSMNSSTYVCVYHTYCISICISIHMCICIYDSNSCNMYMYIYSNIASYNIAERCKPNLENLSDESP